MPVAAPARAAGKRDVELLALQVGFQLAALDAQARFLEQRLEAGDRVGDQLADARPVRRRDVAQRFSQAGERAALAQVLDPRRLHLLLALALGQLLARLGDRCVDLLDHFSLQKRRKPLRGSRRGFLSLLLERIYAAARLAMAANACGSATAMSAS